MALSQPPTSKLLQNAVSPFWIFLFLTFSFPFSRALTLPAWVMGSLQGFLRPRELSTIVALIPLNCNQLPTDPSAPLDFELQEGRAVSVLFTARRQHQVLHLAQRRAKKVKKKKLGSPGRHAI